MGVHPPPVGVLGGAPEAVVQVPDVFGHGDGAVPLLYELVQKRAIDWLPYLDHVSGRYEYFDN